MKEMTGNRNVRSALNALSAVLVTLFNGLFTIVITKMVIERFGSDFNGLNSTANQIVSVLLVMEGGFALASNYALFKPVSAGDHSVINGILVATRNRFRKVGVLFLSCGLVVSIVYTYFVNSNLSYELIFSVVFMTVLPQAFNLYFTTTYRVLLQAQQKEYICNWISLFTITSGHVVNLILINTIGQMWTVRFVTMIFALLNSVLIRAYAIKNNQFVNLEVAPRDELIKGTRDVLFQKITVMVYNAFPIVFLSVSPTGGTILASVYAVYSSVFTMIKSVSYSIVDAPRNGIGQMLAEREKEAVWPVFKQYEYAAFMMIFVLLTTTCTLILPFISLYTEGVTDVNYYDTMIALMMVLITSMEIIHVPSGHMINVAGKFKVNKNIQLIACCTLIITMGIGGSLFGIYGLLAAVLFTSFVLAVSEMGYVHLRMFSKKGFAVLKMIFPLVIIGVIICYAENQLLISCQNYLLFIMYGMIFFVIHALIACGIGYVFNRSVFIGLVNRVSSLMKKVQKKQSIRK